MVLEDRMTRPRRALHDTTVTMTMIRTLLPSAACVHSYHNKSGALCLQRGKLAASGACRTRACSRTA